MQVSREREEQYLREQSRAVWKIVNTFRMGMKYQTSDEDLYQEGMIVLINHLRQAKDEQELKKFPTMDIKNAICRFLMKQEVVSFPKTRTTDYRKVVTSTRRTPIECAIHIKHPDGEDIWIDQIDFESYLETIPERSRDMLLAKLSGEKPTEIAKRFNVTPGAVTHSIQKTITRYLQERNSA